MGRQADGMVNINKGYQVAHRASRPKAENKDG